MKEVLLVALLTVAFCSLGQAQVTFGVPLPFPFLVWTGGGSCDYSSGSYYPQRQYYQEYPDYYYARRYYSGGGYCYRRPHGRYYNNNYYNGYRRHRYCDDD
jgi:hypothetical protein